VEKMNFGKFVKYWIAGFIISAILGVALLVISVCSAVFIGSFITTTTDPTTGEVSITGINPIALAITVVISFVLVPILIGMVSDWVTDKMIS
jgi:hypothetical protein